MRNTTAAFTFVLCVMVAAAACKKKDKEKKQTAPAASDAAAAKAEPPKADPPGTTPNMINKMANCPSAVKDSETKVSTTKTAVVVTVTGAEDAVKAEVVKRAKALASFQDATSDKVEHTGKGTGSGRLGQCPIMLDKVKLAVKEIEGGVEVTITPDDPKRLPALEHAAKARTRALTMGGGNTRKHGSGMGGGGGTGTGGGRGKGDSKGDPTKAKKGDAPNEAGDKK